MFSSVSMPITLRLRLAGSGLFLSFLGGPLVQAIWPQKAGPHGAIRTAATLSATSQSPVGSAASAGLLSPATASAASQDLRTLESSVAATARRRRCRQSTHDVMAARDQTRTVGVNPPSWGG